MYDATTIQVLEELRDLLRMNRDGLRREAELLGVTHGPGDMMLFERAYGIDLAIDELNNFIDPECDRKVPGHFREVVFASGGFDRNGNPRTTPVRTALPRIQVRNIYESELVYVEDEPDPESEGR